METCDGKYSESFLFWISISLRPKTETKRFNFGLSPELRLTNHCGAHHCSSLMPSLRITLLCPRTVGGGGIKRSSASVVRPSSVCLSDVAYIGSNSKTKRLRKTKLCTGVPQVTCDSHTDFKVKRSKVKVTGRGHIVAAT